VGGRGEAKDKPAPQQRFQAVRPSATNGLPASPPPGGYYSHIHAIRPCFAAPFQKPSSGRCFGQSGLSNAGAIGETASQDPPTQSNPKNPALRAVSARISYLARPADARRQKLPFRAVGVVRGGIRMRRLARRPSFLFTIRRDLFSLAASHKSARVFLIGEAILASLGIALQQDAWVCKKETR